jgi:hypothetical protein
VVSQASVHHQKPRIIYIGFILFLFCLSLAWIQRHSLHFLNDGRLLVNTASIYCGVAAG